MTPQEYQEASHRYLQEAQSFLEEGDYPQASEKLCGAAAEMVKAIAEARRWPHDGHAHLFIAIDRLVKETGDKELSILFLATNALHINLYEHWLTPGDVERGAETVARLLQKLAMLASGQ